LHAGADVNDDFWVVQGLILFVQTRRWCFSVLKLTLAQEPASSEHEPETLLFLFNPVISLVVFQSFPALHSADKVFRISTVCVFSF
jgi:hypothetical protein